MNIWDWTAPEEEEPEKEPLTLDDATDVDFEEEPEEPVEVAPGQVTLFGADDEFTLAGQEWKGMPEFIQGDLTPWKSIQVHFESREDMEAFAKLVDQRITTRTRSIWYPEAEIGRFTDKRYVALSQEES